MDDRRGRGRPGLGLSEGDLYEWFDPQTISRGADYARNDMVFDSSVDREGDQIVVHAATHGSSPRPYLQQARFSLDLDFQHSWCTCPMRGDCKHVVAALLTVSHDGAGGADLVPLRPRWTSTLDAVLDEFDRTGEVDLSAHARLGLRFTREEPRVDRMRYRWAGQASGEPDRPPIMVAPVVIGASGRWVQTGATWQPGRHASRTPLTAAMDRLANLWESEQEGYGYYRPSGPTDRQRLEVFGPGLVAALREFVRTGGELVGAQGVGDVRLAEGPGRVEIDVRSEDDELSLSVGVRLGDRWFDAADVDLLGLRAHGFAAFVSTGDRRLRDLVIGELDPPPTAAMKELLEAREAVEVSGDEREDLVRDYLPRLQRHLPVSSGDGSVIIDPLPEPRLVLAVEWLAADHARTAWQFRYRRGGTDVHSAFGVGDVSTGRELRDRRAERRLLARLDLPDAASSLRHLDGSLRAGGEIRGVAAVDLAHGVLPALESAGIEIAESGERPFLVESSEPPEIVFANTDTDAVHAPDAAIDWLDLSVTIGVDGHTVALAEVIRALTNGAEIIVAGASFVKLDRPEFDELRALVAAAAEIIEQPEGSVIRVGTGDLGLWEQLAELGIVEGQARQWADAAVALKQLTTLPAVDPAEIEADLRPYQLDGFRWLAFLWSFRLGGILADDMGLGKTLQTLALVAHASAKGSGPFLVVAPTSVIATWVGEAAQFAPQLTVRTVTESERRRGVPLDAVVDGADVVVTTYTLLRLEAEDYQRIRWGGLVLDEAQQVKNHQGKTYQCVRKLDAEFRLALTGTPMENRLIELWSLLSIVAPGIYPRPERFTEQVAKPVEKEGDTAALERFRRRIRPFLLRRTKELVASDLPPKTEQVLPVKLSTKHRRIYDTHLQRERQHVMGLIGDFDKQRIAIFKSLTRLRQLSLDPALIDEEYEGVGSSKIEALVDHLVEIRAEGHRALVFSQFTSFLTRVRARLDAVGIESQYLDGRTKNRAGVVSDFKSGRGEVFLISLKAGGVGLTLTEADYVFVMDPWWNPAVEAQAVDRAHRIGQSRPVMVYRLVSENTIEERVMELKERKAALFRDVMDGGGGTATPITADDVRRLFD